jgi:hypothetical protein
MKRSLLILILALSILFIGACDSSSCSDCSYTPNEHVVVSYTNSAGQTVYVSLYADSSGCITISNCNEILQ